MPRTQAEVNEYVTYAKRLSDRLYADFQIAKHFPTVFRPLRSCCYHRYQGGMHQIVMSYRVTEDYMDRGYHEYKTLQYLMAGRRPTGLAAVHAIVLHEFAHVLTTEKALETGDGWLRAYRSHGLVFAQHLRRLMEAYPFVLPTEPIVPEQPDLFFKPALPKAPAPVRAPLWPRFDSDGQLGFGILCGGAR